MGNKKEGGRATVRARRRRRGERGREVVVGGGKGGPCVSVVVCVGANDKTDKHIPALKKKASQKTAKQKNKTEKKYASMSVFHSKNETPRRAVSFGRQPKKKNLQRLAQKGTKWCT